MDYFSVCRSLSLCHQSCTLPSAHRGCHVGSTIRPPFRWHVQPNNSTAVARKCSRCAVHNIVWVTPILRATRNVFIKATVREGTYEQGHPPRTDRTAGKTATPGRFRRCETLFGDPPFPSRGAVVQNYECVGRFFLLSKCRASSERIMHVITNIDSPTVSLLEVVIPERSRRASYLSDCDTSLGLA